jgi:hypothetical protein
LGEIERVCIEHFNPILNGRSLEYAPTTRIQISLSSDVLDAVCKLADKENRSISNMLATLVSEAINARKEQGRGPMVLVDMAA